MKPTQIYKNYSNSKIKIVVGMSGGVDSSVVLCILKQQGFEPIGVSLKFGVWDNPQNALNENVCCSQAAFKIAQQICSRLNVPYYIWDVSDNFQNKVIKYFIQELSQKRTPNPCIVCNYSVKIQSLLEFARKQNIKYVATGHYSKVIYNSKTKEVELRRAKDHLKDQSYFLSGLNQKQLKYLVLPLGNLYKKEVYQLAKEFHLEMFSYIKQSQDFCFVANKSLPIFYQKIFGNQQGKILDINGKVLGKHNGLYYYTLGQRKGIGLPGGPFYVCRLDLKNNSLIVTKNQRDLLRQHIVISPYHLINSKEHTRIEKKQVYVKVRSQDHLSKCKIRFLTQKRALIVLAKPKMSVSSGQFAVLYDGQKCLGNGRIIDSY